MPKIHVLPPEVCNKIAAGEVIERPASVVKELVENSLDAGAARIQVELEEGGKRLIRVVDDGEGMAPEDLALAFLSHATSKLQRGEDLFSIQTMGFRGEALPSVAAVAQARIVTRARGETSGAAIEARGGEISPVKAHGAAEGTTVEVRNLFFNTPVRRKFLRTVPTEMAHISDILTRIALANPAVHIILVHNGRRVFNLPPAQRPIDRIEALFGREIAQGLIPVEAPEGPVRVTGFAAPPHVDRANSKMQFTFVNGRYIRDQTLFHAISDAYRGMMMQRRYPVCFLHIELDPHDVDVNVHPTKIEVRFKDSRTVHQALRGAPRRAFEETSLAPTLETPQRPPQPPPRSAEQRREDIKQSVADFFTSQTTRTPFEPSARPAPQPMPHPAPPRQPFAEPSRASRRFVQVHDSYIVEETPGGFSVIDQHALHERIVHEQIRESIESKPLPSQRLLVPETVQLAPEEYFSVLSMKDDLARLGVEVDEFGQSTIIIRSFPQILKNAKPEEFIRGMLEDLAEREEGTSAKGRLDKLMEVMACRAAVKAGKSLAPSEILALLEQRDKLDLAATCPHGRPTTLSFSRDELEKQFRRK